MVFFKQHKYPISNSFLEFQTKRRFMFLKSKFTALKKLHFHKRCFWRSRIRSFFMNLVFEFYGNRDWFTNGLYRLGSNQDLEELKTTRLQKNAIRKSSWFNKPKKRKILIYQKKLLRKLNLKTVFQMQKKTKAQKGQMEAIRAQFAWPLKTPLKIWSIRRHWKPAMEPSAAIVE